MKRPLAHRNGVRAHIRPAEGSTVSPKGRLYGSVLMCAFCVMVYLLGASPTRAEASNEPRGDSIASNAPRSAVRLKLSSVYESNIDHDDLHTDSYGLVTRLRAFIQRPGPRSALRLDYEGAFLSYSKTDKWDRVTHKVGASYERDLMDNLTVVALAELESNASTEDREFANQYTLNPHVEFEPVDPLRLNLYGAYRLKRFGESRGSDETHLFSGIEIRARPTRASTWEFEYRYENSDSRSLSRRYTRQRFRGRLEVAADSHNVMKMEVEYRPRRFADRWVEVSETEVRREDERWIPAVSWVYRLASGHQFELGYEFQMRTSNDPDKVFDAHQATFIVTWPVIG
jgi:hypothetical protein